MRWFTSDTHFGHTRIIELCNRPFEDVDEMNEAIISRWNSVVSPEDVVLHLGDVALGTIAVSLPLVGRLNGYKALVPGNHDRIFSQEKGLKRTRFFPEYYKVFDQVLPEQVHLTLKNGVDVNVCHFPYSGDSHGEDRYATLRPRDDGLPIIHGHVHNEWKVRDLQVNVGVDVWDFYPVPEDVIIDIIGVD